MKNLSKRVFTTSGIVPLFLSYILIFLVFLLVKPGLISADTKLDLMVNPRGFLAGASQLWNENLTLGQLQNQAYGYFFPQGFFYYFFNYLNFPIWIIQRLWWSLLITVGIWGIIKLSRLLITKQTFPSVIGGLAYVCSPQIWGSLTSISSEVWPLVLASWILYVTADVIGRGEDATGLTKKVLWFKAGQVAALVFCLGAINAVASLIALLPALIWWLYYLGKTSNKKSILNFGFYTLILSILVSLWWIVPLLILGKLSPPFLDYIESAHTTNRWNSLVEVLRGTTNWTYFLSDSSPVASFFVSNWGGVLLTGLLAILGLVGIAKSKLSRSLFVMLMAGIMFFALGYVGLAGAAFPEQWLKLLDGVLSPLRNIHKFDCLLRIPLSLGIVVLLNAVNLPTFKLSTILTVPVNLIILFVVSAIMIIPLANGLLTKNAFTKIPNYWEETSAWLQEHTRLSGTDYHSRVLVLPGASFAEQVWGFTRDEPLQPLAKTPWAVRDSIPLIPAEGIRMLDSVQDFLARGIPNDNLAKFLISQGFSHIVLRADLQLNAGNNRSILPTLHALNASNNIKKVAEFGTPLKQVKAKNTIYGTGVESTQPPIQIYELQTAGIKAAPYLTNLDNLERIAGCAEALLPLHLNNSLTTGIFLTNQADEAWKKNSLIITDTPSLREADYGKDYFNQSGQKSFTDRRTTFNRMADYQTDYKNHTTQQWQDAVTTYSSAADEAGQLGNIIYSAGIKAALDNNPSTAWVSGGLSGAVGQWIKLDFKHSYQKLALSLLVGKALGAQVSKVQIETNSGSILQEVKPQQKINLVLPRGETKWLKITAMEVTPGLPNIQFAIAELQLKDLSTGQQLNLYPSQKLPEVAAQENLKGIFFANQFLGSSSCMYDQDYFNCDKDLQAESEETTQMLREISLKTNLTVKPNLLVQPNFATISDYINNNNLPNIRVVGPSRVTDPRGGTLALLDNNPETIWESPAINYNQGIKQVKLHFKFSHKVKLNKIEFDLPKSKVMDFAIPKLVSLNYGQGRQIARLSDNKHTVLLASPTEIDNLDLIILRWDKKYREDSLRNTSLRGPALAGIKFYAGDKQILNQTNTPNLVNFPCGMGPQLVVNNASYSTRVVGNMRDIVAGRLLPVKFCAKNGVDEVKTIDLPKGNNIIAVKNNQYFTAATVNLLKQNYINLQPKLTEQSNPKIVNWETNKRTFQVTADNKARLLVIPESFNSGWKAITAAGTPLTAVKVDGWQQSWIVPSGYSGSIETYMPLNRYYQLFLGVGLLFSFLFMWVILLLSWFTGRQKNSQKPGFYENSLTRINNSKFLQLGGGILFYFLFNWYGIGIFILFNCLFKKKYSWLMLGSGLISFIMLVRNPWNTFNNYGLTINLAQIGLIITLSTLWGIVFSDSLPTKFSKRFFNIGKTKGSNRNSESGS